MPPLRRQPCIVYIQPADHAPMSNAPLTGSSSCGVPHRSHHAFRYLRPRHDRPEHFTHASSREFQRRKSRSRGLSIRQYRAVWYASSLLILYP